MPRVFVIQRPARRDPVTQDWVDKYDISAAEVHGELVELLPRGNIPRDLRGTISRLRSSLLDYTERDHILAIGDPVAIAAAVMVASSITNGVVSILKWDRRSQSYLPYLVKIG